MCVIAAVIAAGAISAAASAAQYSGQQEAANAQSDFENKQYTYTRRAATANYLQEVSQIQNRTMQQSAQIQDQDSQQKLQGEAGKGKASVAFSSRGVDGNSVHEALGEFDRIEALNHTNLARSLNWQIQQAGQDELSARAQAQDRIAGAAPQPVQFPSALAAGLGIGSTALQTFNTAQYATQSGIYNPNNAGYLKSPIPLI